MTREEAIEKIKKSMECHDRKVCGLAETCEECPLYVDKDTEYEAHKVLIKALSQEPSTFNWVQNRVDLAKAEINNAIESTFCTKDEAIGLGIALNVIDKYFTI